MTGLIKQITHSEYYDKWCDLNEQTLDIYASEHGLDRELDWDSGEFYVEVYTEYLESLVAEPVDTEDKLRGYVVKTRDNDLYVTDQPSESKDIHGTTCIHVVKLDIGRAGEFRWVSTDDWIPTFTITKYSELTQVNIDDFKIKSQV